MLSTFIRLSGQRPHILVSFIVTLQHNSIRIGGGPANLVSRQIVDYRIKFPCFEFQNMHCISQISPLLFKYYMTIIRGYKKSCKNMVPWYLRYTAFFKDNLGNFDQFIMGLTQKEYN